MKGLIAVLFALVILGLAFFLYKSPAASPGMTEVEIAQIGPVGAQIWSHHRHRRHAGLLGAVGRRGLGEQELLLEPRHLLHELEVQQMPVIDLQKAGHLLDLGAGNGGQPPLDVGDVLAGVVAQRAGQIVLTEAQLGPPDLDELADDLAHRTPHRPPAVGR